MKIFLSFILSLFLSFNVSHLVSAEAESLDLYWDSPSSSGDLSGYTVFYRKESDPVRSVNVSGARNTNYTFQNLQGPANYYFSVASVAQGGATSRRTTEISKYIEGTVDNSNPTTPGVGVVSASIKGRPNINSVVHSGLFVWENNGTFNVRMPAGSEKNVATYKGKIRLTGAGATFQNLTDGGLNESNDVTKIVRVNNSTQEIRFTNHVVGRAQDGFSFRVNSPGKIELILNRPGKNGVVIFLGRNFTRAKSNTVLLRTAN